jgi:predicted TIM-barrel fold metal-dependent hydrolase
MRIVDAHQHLWDKDLFSYSWCEKVPSLDRSFRMADYVEAIRGLNVEKSVHVEAEVDEPYMLEETRHILKLAEAKDNPLEGVVACGQPENDGFRRYLDKIAGHPALKGIRRELDNRPDELSQSRTFVDNINLLASYDLTFDLCVLARQLTLATNLVRSCPRVSFILNHCGIPLVKEKAIDPWRESVRKISEFPNVCCKISGLVAYADHRVWTEDDLRPFVEHTIECFGWDRVMFGSDWPVCIQSATLRKWLETLSRLTQTERPANRDKLFYGNAVRVYRLNN